MIEVRNLTRYYGEFAALTDVSFKVTEGQVIGLLGRNGAGKSTTLKILAGLIPPSSGTVTVDGIDMVAEPHRLRSRIGYLPEDPPVYEDMTVTSFVRHIGRMKGMSASEVDARLPEVLATAALGGRENQVIGTLSHGYRKRVGIAQAVIANPRLVILDEPTSGLDPVQIRDMRKVIRDLAKGRVVMVSSHILREVEQTCDWLLVLRDGKLVAQGTEEALTADQNRKMQIVVRGDANTLVEWLTKHPAVEDAVTRPMSDGTTSAVVTLRADAREQLAADLIAAGFGLRELRGAGDALEEVFLGLASGKAGAA